MTTPRTRTRRLFASAAAFALAVTGVAIAAPSAEAAPAPRTYTATLTTAPSPSGTVTPGVQADYSLVVTNSSTSISALDRVRVTIPAGFTVVTGTVSRTGWTQTVSGSTLTAKTSNGLFFGVAKGKSVTIKFKATAPAGCTSGKFDWPLRVDGVLLVFSTSSPTPSVTVNPVADRFEVTSVTDVDSVLDGDQVLKSPDSFSVSGAFLCGESLSAPAGVEGSVALVESGAGGFVGITSTFVLSTDTTATISGVAYDKVENNVGIDITWNGASSGSIVVDVLGAAKTSEGKVDDTLTVPGATTTLTNGANGPVSLALVACDPNEITDAPCSRGTEIALTGDFKGRYTEEDPAFLTWICDEETCPHTDVQSEWESLPGTPNPNCAQLFSCYQSSSAPFGLRDVEEDFADYPVWVSLAVQAVEGEGGGYTDFAQAGRCISTPTVSDEDFWEFSNYLSARYDFLNNTGTIEDADAVAAGFCVDVNAITRDLETGALSIPVLFVEDPRLRP